MLSMSARGFASSDIATFKLPSFMGVHRLDEKDLPTTASVTKEEMLGMFKNMATMRRMETVADQLYKKREIRGFCHLYDGQEAIAEGMESAMTRKDAIITAYRNHCQAYARGESTYAILAEMMGKSTGSSKGKGGSMHYYRASERYYGGNGIVGAQMPVGTGLAFALKYNKEDAYAVTMYGDGAANQGQLYEAANMAGLWQLPIIYICENNHYGMGTSQKRASHNDKFHQRGDLIPGIHIDAQNVLMVKETMKWAGAYVKKNGPLFLEFDTYRYHGHSMSDPGITYRTKDEVMNMRQTRDPVEIARQMILEKNWSTEKELKAQEKEIRAIIDKEVE
jgi:pyruvate dehydrogenase E1 component alpha subunit